MSLLSTIYKTINLLKLICSIFFNLVSLCSPLKNFPHHVINCTWVQYWVPPGTLQGNTEVNWNQKEISSALAKQYSVIRDKWFRNHTPFSILQSLNLQLTSATPITLYARSMGVVKIMLPSKYRQRDIKWFLNIFYLERHQIAHQQNWPEIGRKAMKLNYGNCNWNIPF